MEDKKQKSLDLLKKMTDTIINEDAFYKHFLDAIGSIGKNQLEFNLRKDAINLNEKEIKSNFIIYMIKEFIDLKHDSMHNYKAHDFLMVLKEFEVFSKSLINISTDVFKDKDGLKPLDEYGKYLEKSFKLFFDKFDEKV